VLFLMPKADVVVNARRAPCLTQLTQLRFRLLKPVGHAHFAVHRHRGGEVLLGLLAIAPAAVKSAETQVTVSDERAHAAGRCINSARIFASSMTCAGGTEAAGACESTKPEGLFLAVLLYVSWQRAKDVAIRERSFSAEHL
jgi:hypothetical protein